METYLAFVGFTVAILALVTKYFDFRIAYLKFAQERREIDKPQENNAIDVSPKSNLKKLKRIVFMNHQECESQKAQGWSIYRDTAATVAERAAGLLLVAQSHYYKHNNPPAFKTYVSHWLWACRGNYDQAVLHYLTLRYPSPRKPRIQPGFSDWNSFGDPHYSTSAK